MKTMKTTTIFKFQKLVFLYFLFAGKIISAQTQTVTIGNTSGISSAFYGPIYRPSAASVLVYCKYSYIYRTSELGIPAGSKITKIEYLKATGGTLSTPVNKMYVSMKNTSDTIFAFDGTVYTDNWNNLNASTTRVYVDTTFKLTVGNNSWVSLPFNGTSTGGVDTFPYTGDNLQINVDFQKVGTQSGPSINFYSNSAVGKAIGTANQTPITGTAPMLTSATYGNSRPTIRITYILPPPCSGTPTIDSITTTATTTCPSVPFTLTGYTSASGTGLSFQWMRANDAAFSSGVTTLTTSSILTTSQTAPHYYKLITNCSSTGLSHQQVVFIDTANFYECYCANYALSAADEDVFNVTFGSLNNSSNCATTAPGSGSIPQQYSNYRNITPPAVEKLSVVPFSIQAGTCLNNYPNTIAIWIDYDHSGTFDTGERVYASTSPTSGAHTETGTVTIPVTALTGLTGMRVISFEGGSAQTSACGIYTFGETEDYVINITSTTNCSGSPTPGNTVASSTTVCVGATTNLSLQNLTTGQGVTYQWYGPNGLISGATNSIYTATVASAGSYYAAVTCNNSGLTTNSTPVAITLSNFLNCYCTNGAGADVDDEILSLTLNGVTNTSNCTVAATGTGSILNKYSNFSPLGNLTSIALGSTVSFSLNVDNCPNPVGPYFPVAVAIWVDLNHNGSFGDAGEQLFVESAALLAPRTVTGTITIPCTALPGQTRIRIVEAEGLSGSQIPFCGQYGYGETEDYLINLTGTSCTMALTIKAFIQGFVTGPNTMAPVLLNQMVGSDPLVTDSVTVELRGTSSPFALIASKKVPMSTNGIATPTFPGASAGLYYIVLKHRNAIETWSAAPVAVSNGASYDFSTAANKAYGSNQILVNPGMWALYNADVNQDQNVDLGDISLLENDINNFEFGYFATDINGDGNVDLGDVSITETNVNNFIFSTHP